ncbi:MAG: glutathione S-transferase [Betaproteobacteria bacterium]|nr:glutathione S-transferase [Betaproteobacteria bacterium]
MPILYTFRRCPYAIRARLAVHASGVAVEMREVDLKHKPQAMLEASPKGTVPVLRLPDGRVIDESLDIMRWALALHDPAGWLRLSPGALAEAGQVIERNDGPFKRLLDRYKYPNRAPAGEAPRPASAWRDEAAPILADLDDRLSRHACLLGESPNIADAAIVPFVRQFAMVDAAWFAATPWRALARWLDGWLASPRFMAVMQKQRADGAIPARDVSSGHPGIP